MKHIPIITPSGHAMLNVRRICDTARIDPDIINTDNLTIVTQIEAETGALLVRLQHRLAGKVTDSKEAVYPANWWEAVKERWMPRRLRRRFPIKQTVVTLEASAFYPSVRIPNHNPFVQVTINKTSGKTNA